MVELGRWSGGGGGGRDGGGGSDGGSMKTNFKWERERERGREGWDRDGIVM